jgi:SepF-like predicted cell division protein (DUF552 family)
MKLLYIALISILFSACKKDVVTAKNDITDVVVEAYLYPQKKATVKLSNLAHYDTDHPVTNIKNLSVSISVADKKEYLTYVDSGNYILTDTTFIQAGQNISLEVETDTKKITSSSIIPTKPTNFIASVYEITMPDLTTGTRPVYPDPILLTWDNMDGGYYLVIIETSEIAPEEISTRNFGNGGNTPSKNNTFSIRAQSFHYYGKNRVILFKINPEYSALYNTNSNSSQSLTNPPTNIINGFGIFTGVNSDTLFVNVKKYL